MKILKWIFIVLIILGIAGYVSYLVLDEEIPQGDKGEKAEQLADKMLAAVNDSAWQEIAVISWDFSGRHQLVWDKNRHWAKVSWDNYDVFLKLDSKKGVAFAKGRKVEREEVLNELLKTAYEFWANDSFWLNPITKIRDGGTERKYVPQNNDQLEGLLVTYKSGGVTPGDSYLWTVDKSTGLPKYVKMWVQIIPLGGIKFTWEDWHTTPNGAKIATLHENLINSEISNIQSWTEISEYPEKNSFEVLSQ
jgi:hypothetical protein